MHKYVEVDFPSVTATKARKICTNPVLSSALFPHDASPNGNDDAASTTNTKPKPKPIISKGGTRLDSALYSLIPLDLRKSTDPEQGLEANLFPALDRDLPTLVVAECLFCYMSPEEGDQVLGWFAKTFRDCTVIVYEMHGLR